MLCFFAQQLTVAFQQFLACGFQNGNQSSPRVIHPMILDFLEPLALPIQVPPIVLCLMDCCIVCFRMTLRRCLSVGEAVSVKSCFVHVSDKDDDEKFTQSLKPLLNDFENLYWLN